MKKIPSSFDSKDKIPFLHGRPDREIGITKDDVLNLAIALATAGDVLKLFDDKHLFRQPKVG